MQTMTIAGIYRRNLGAGYDIVRGSKILAERIAKAQS